MPVTIVIALVSLGLNSIPSSKLWYQNLDNLWPKKNSHNEARPKARHIRFTRNLCEDKDPKARWGLIKVHVA